VIDPYANLNQHIKLPAHLRKTWRYDTTAQHWTVVDCKTAAEYGECPHYANGFVLEFPTSGSDAQNLLQVTADMRAAGYVFTQVESPRGKGYAALVFPPEQQCLASRKVRHRIRRDEPALLTVVGGDHRGNPRGEDTLKHTSGESWMDHMHEHMDRLHTAADNMKE
jgi:hypothetical protein